MSTRKLRLTAVLAMLACGNAHALTVPSATAQDEHLQVVPFTSDVIGVQGEVGIMSVIHFGEGEVVKEYGMGDKGAWNVKYDGNQIAFVPVADKADTNMFVVTNRHKYWFKVALASHSYPVVPADGEVAKKGHAAAKTFLSSTWELDIQYPLAERQAALVKSPAVIAAAKKAKLESAFDRAKREGRLDADYGYIGDDEVMPTAAYNNGEMTYIVFGPDVILPEVYEKDKNGKEARVAKHYENDMMVVHTVARKLIIRRGTYAGCLIDGHFNPIGMNTNTDTISPNVKRELNAIGAESKASESQ